MRSESQQQILMGNVQTELLRQHQRANERDKDSLETLIQRMCCTAPRLLTLQNGRAGLQ